MKMAHPAVDSPPPYHSLTEADSTQKNAATIPEVVISTIHENDTGLLVRTDFDDDNARITFMLKVLAIVLPQKMATGLIIGIILAIHYVCFDIRYNRKNLIVIASLLHLSTLIALFYCTEARKQRPYNYMFLAALPLSTGFSIVVLTCDIILAEIGVVWFIYVVVVLAQMMYSIFCLDGTLKFYVRNGILLTAGILIVYYATMSPILYNQSPFAMFYLSLLVFVDCSFLTYRLYAMTSREYHCALAPSDFVNGALCLYTDTWYIICRFFRTAAENLFFK